MTYHGNNSSIWLDVLFLHRRGKARLQSHCYDNPLYRNISIPVSLSPISPFDILQIRKPTEKMAFRWEGGLAPSCFHLFGNRTLPLYLHYIRLKEVFHFRHSNYQSRHHPSKRNLLPDLMGIVNLSCKHSIYLQEISQM